MIQFNFYYQTWQLYSQIMGSGAFLKQHFLVHHKKTFKILVNSFGGFFLSVRMFEMILSESSVGRILIGN
jgi:hypothetical protein